MIKISVVIPVYNCEDYLGQCIGSVRKQTLKELEILCVDDGSTDRSVQAIRNIMSEEPRVFLFSQENKGAGEARNLAMEKAKGKYIAFLDADDCYLDADALEKMYDACEKKQVAACVSRWWHIGGKTEEVEPFFRGREGHTVLSYCDYQVDYNFMNYLIKKELLRTKGIRFPFYRRFEDPVFLARALYEAKKFTVANTCLYNYRLPDAVSRFYPGNTRDMLCGLIDNLKFAREHGLKILFGNTVRRLEYEYMFIILRNILPDDRELLKLLMQANQIICDHRGDPDYVIRPLRAVLLYASRYGERLLEKIRGEKEIRLYGAGRFGRVFLKFLQKNGLSLKVVGFVVSGPEGNASRVEKVPVVELRDLCESERHSIFVTVGSEKHPGIEKSLKETGCKDYVIVREEFLCLMAEEQEREERVCQE